MPCVCLRNTFRHWQTLKALKVSSIKAERNSVVRSVSLAQQSSIQPNQTATASAVVPPASASNHVLRIHHPRTRIVKTAPQSPQILQPLSVSAVVSKMSAITKEKPTAKAKVTTKEIHTSKDGLTIKTLSTAKTKPSRADLINAESHLGSAIFGPIPAGHRREFFHDRQNVWIWHEDWRDETDNTHQLTVRYEVRLNGVYKKISTGRYFKLEGAELTNFRRATRAYLYMIKKYLYNQPQAA